MENDTIWPPFIKSAAFLPARCEFVLEADGGSYHINMMPWGKWEASGIKGSSGDGHTPLAALRSLLQSDKGLLMEEADATASLILEIDQAMLAQRLAQAGAPASGTQPAPAAAARRVGVKWGQATTIDLNLDKFLAWAPSSVHLRWLRFLMEKGDVVGSCLVLPSVKVYVDPSALPEIVEYRVVRVRTALFSCERREFRVFATEDEIEKAVKVIDEKAKA